MKTVPSLLVIVVATASMAFAQQPAAPTAPANVQPGMAANMQIAPEDVQFVEKAALGGLYEVQSSQLATTASQNAEVKAFAQQMIQDHTMASSELKRIAIAKNIPVPMTLAGKYANMIERLSKVQGEEFDNMYGKQQRRAHDEAVGLFENAAANAKDPDLKAFAEKALPVLKSHQEKAKTLPGGGDASQ